MSDEILPHGESLRRALRWMSEQGRHDAAAIDEAAQRFDLTPLEEDFLRTHFKVRGKETDPRQP
jgi:hypothetical protein